MIVLVVLLLFVLVFVFVFVLVFFLTASPCASVAFLWMGFDGWLFGGLTLLGPPAISFSEALCEFQFTLLLTPSFMVSSDITSMLL